MLTKWLEIEGEGATKEEITYILEGLKMSKALEGVFNNSQNKIMSTEDDEKLCCITGELTGVTIAICFIKHDAAADCQLLYEVHEMMIIIVVLQILNSGVMLTSHRFLQLRSTQESF